MRPKLLAAVAILTAATVAAPVVAHASAPSPEVGHCVDVGPVYVLGQVVIGLYEVCVPV